MGFIAIIVWLIVLAIPAYGFYAANKEVGDRRHHGATGSRTTTGRTATGV